MVTPENGAFLLFSENAMLRSNTNSQLDTVEMVNDAFASGYFCVVSTFTAKLVGN